jgi:hypothetical protein
MLNYLVTSNVRKGLLKLLWSEGASGSVQALGRMAGVSYASAHSELAEMEKHGLAVSRGQGKAVVFQANAAHPQADVLRRLLEDLPPPAESEDDEENLLANLKRYGAPLQTDAPLRAELSVEETLAQALVLSHKNPTVLRALPVAVLKNLTFLDVDLLMRRANEHRENRSLGFVLDVAGTLAKDRALKRAAAQLHDRRVKHHSPYFVTAQGKFAQELARRNTPALAKKWHFVVNMPMESFRGLYEKFAPEGP